MKVKPKTAKLLFSLYAAIITVLFSLWLYSESTALLISFNLLLILLYVWVFLKVRYFLSLVKDSTSIMNTEIILLRVLCIILICSNCYVVYINIKYL